MKFSLDMLWKSRTFWVVIGLFAAANLASASRVLFVSGRCEPGSSVGFPFPVRLCSAEEIYVTGLLLDLIVAWTAAVLAVWLVRLVRGTGG